MYIIFFLIAFLIRLIFLPNPGFEADISFWKSWGLAPFDHGLVWSLYNTNNNYPTPFAYLLWIITSIYSLFANPHNWNQFWNANNTLYLTIVKLPSVLADLGIAGIILYIGKHAEAFGFPTMHTSHYNGKLQMANDKYSFKNFKLQTSNFYLLLAMFYLFNPVAIIDGALWGQVDSVGVFLFLLALLSVFRKSPFFAGLFYMVALMTKLQTMIYAPLFFLFLWLYFGYKGLVKSIIGATIAFFGLNIELFLARDMGRVIQSLVDNYDYFPYLSLNAHNLWWIVSGANGMGVSDKILTIGIVNAKTMGLMLFSSSYLLAILTVLRSGIQKIDVAKQDLTHAFFTGLIIVTSAFFLFQTQSHDRYAFPVIVFALLAMPYAIQYTIAKENMKTFYYEKSFQMIVIAYILLSFFYTLNLHTALIINYPQNGFWFLMPFKHASMTLMTAYIFLSAFFLFLWANRKTIGTYTFLFVSSLFVVGIFAINLPFLTKKPIPLSGMSPVSIKQGFGGLRKDMSVGSSGKSETWTRLSTQYFFYPDGLGTHANSEIIYPIAGRFSRFTTDMGIDTESGNQASVQFEIWGDTNRLFQSSVMGRYTNPIHADVDITGVQNLILKVDGGANNYDDHADWLSPKLWP